MDEGNSCGNTAGDERVGFDELINRQEDEAAKAFVAITIQIPAQDIGANVAVYSGFVAVYKHQWFLVTAEHVFTGTDTALGLDFLIDRYPEAVVSLLPFHRAGLRMSTRIRFDNKMRFGTEHLAEVWGARCDSATKALISAADIMVIPLYSYYAENLRSIGVVPFSWEQECFMDEDEFLKRWPGAECVANLFGVLAKSVQVESDEYSAIQHSLPLQLANDALESPPFVYWLPLWDPDEVPHDVVGASGGPIIGFGADVPYVLGIQVAQDKVDGVRRLKSVDAR